LSEPTARITHEVSPPLAKITKVTPIVLIHEFRIHSHPLVKVSCNYMKIA